MKLTWNAISREGLKIYSISLDTLGFFARCVEDLDLICDAFQIHDDPPHPLPDPHLHPGMSTLSVTSTPSPTPEAKSPEPNPKTKTISEMKIGMCKTSIWANPSNVTPSLARVWQEAAKLLRTAGATVVELNLPNEFDEVSRATELVTWTEGRSSFLGEYCMKPELLHQEFKDYVENRKGLTRADQLKAYDLLNRLMPVFDGIAEEYDVSYSLIPNISSQPID